MNWLLRFLRRLIPTDASETVPTPTTTPAPEEVPSCAVAFDVERIRSCGWWQGAVVDGALLREQFPNLSGEADYYVVATQTCSLFNPDLSKVPSVELVAARQVLGTEFDTKLAAGFNPRRLHVEAGNASGELLCLELEVHDRIWLERAALQAMSPTSFALRDTGILHVTKPRATFARWLGKSYTRVELPDEFNSALESSKVLRLLDQIVKRHADRIEGVYFAFTRPEDPEGDPLTDDEISRLLPPYEVEITLVAFSHEDLPPLRAELAKLDDALHPQAESQPGAPKLSKRSLAQSAGISILAERVETITTWHVSDLLENVRFTNFDYLSGPDDDTE